ncbi:MAG: nucleotide 5'-monophosphate nucleosidase PpnN [Dokdonella sp.]|uniref:nucleotide 5'-monophosphate nucleosidase PpnN n=3 Tax=Dokdonella sp. TaxID=2291710 RepID=UPI002BDCCAFD|nr:LOG family protein [Xanthomonadales bacterium]MBL0222164.1 LOG family protein [Xanthomonadales bacterium]HQV71922.1 nucleotide 5'-monophosphate nucleosidase PpnN [Dokdonella sp.]HQY54082.1 nucleotide 5'-monophosphate nucleosidase PpnN [Dokdonella sp.]
MNNPDPSPIRPLTVSARLGPASGLDVLSRQEVARLRDASAGGLHQLLRSCALAVLTQGLVTDDPRAASEMHADFEIQVLQQDRGVGLELINAPAHAFVDGKIIRGINELLFAVVRDIVFVSTQIEAGSFDLDNSVGITHAVFDILRNARVLRANVAPNLVVCWGGHSISRYEYDYTKHVGYQLGLRDLDICTGCGPGAMKGPMKGATIGHAKQRRSKNRYIGITEPGIIAAESPNPIVNNLIIMPDIEKRLEAFVRTAHAIIVFPGGVGTAEEILYLLGIMLHPANAGIPYPLIFTGPSESAAYFEQIDRFLRLALGDEVASHYQIIIDDPGQVARQVAKGVERVRKYRLESGDAFFFNWAISIDESLQHPFHPTHEAMASLNLHREQPRHEFAADLRRAFSGIVAGNVKIEGMRAIEQHGPFLIRGDDKIMQALDDLLAGFVSQQRMKLPGTAAYVPCYRVLHD